ncbi:LptF/LptG family permease [Robiginitalea sp.]|uniref:LptF/LptG family permease n=1 Tax=Robiginitalea sp. TaxID=1902411 RepID=UPI003C746DED
MRILDQYILKRFLMNFFSSFVILMFIFIFQTIWLFIDDLAGKGLDFVIIGKFLFYLLPNLTEKVLPLTVLLSSILTFGALAENYEFAAMKASGISLQRAMLYLIVFVVFLGGVAFYFANTVIPISEQKIYNLRRNIATMKPAAVIVEGVFSDFEGRNIKVGRKYGENDRFLEDVIIHMKSRLQRNTTVIRAEKGELVSGSGSDIIQLKLMDGHYYEELIQKSGTAGNSHPFTKADFDVYLMNIEIPDNLEDLEADRNVETDKMKNVRRLITDIDSIQEHNRNLVAAFSSSISSRMGAFPLRDRDSVPAVSDSILNLPDSVRILAGSIIKMPDTVAKAEGLGVKTMDSSDIVGNLPQEVLVQKTANLKEAERPYIEGDALSPFKTWEQGQILDASKNSVRNLMNSVRGKGEDLELSYKRYNLHILSLHKKFALAFSCIILFFVGAPLGAIIRKGGLGLPMVIAIVLFLAYYFFGVFSSNYAKEGNIHPVLGAWLPTLIMLPLGIWLTRRATADRGLMSFGHFLDFIKERFSRTKEAD